MNREVHRLWATFGALAMLALVSVLFAIGWHREARRAWVAYWIEHDLHVACLTYVRACQEGHRDDGTAAPH